MDSLHWHFNRHLLRPRLRMPCLCFLSVSHVETAHDQCARNENLNCSTLKSHRVERQVLEFERIGQRPLDHCFLSGNWRETMGRAKIVAPRDVNDLSTQRQHVPIKQTDVSDAV